MKKAELERLIDDQQGTLEDLEAQEASLRTALSDLEERRAEAQGQFEAVAPTPDTPDTPEEMPGRTDTDAQQDQDDE